MGYQLKSAISCKDIAQIHNLPLIGRNYDINNISPLADITSGSLSFCKGQLNQDTIKDFSSYSKQITIIANLDNLNDVNWDDLNSIVFLHSSSPRLDFIQILDHLEQNIGFSTYDFDPIIDPSVKIGSNVVIEKGCIIEENVILEHNVVIQKGTKIGKNTRIRANTSLGGDGFGFERLDNGVPIRFPHLGGTRIGACVEVGSNVCIARGTLSDTIIEDNVKIDNLVHIAHNCHIKQNVLITACAEISGSVTIGENTWIAPNCSIINKVTIGQDAMVGIGAVVVKDIEDHTRCAGNPARKLH